MKRFSPSGQHYPDPSKPPENYAPDEPIYGNAEDGCKKVKTTQSFESLFDNETLSDIVIDINDGQFVFNGHKMIISMKSAVLASMLNDTTLSEDREILHLQELPECSQVFSRFLFFIYSGAVWLHREYVLELHKLAEKYMVKALSQHCESYILQIMHKTLVEYDSTRGFPIDVICDIYESDSFCGDIHMLSFQILCAKYKELVTSERWQKCSSNLVCDLMKSDNCRAEENIILTSATDWMKKNSISEKNLIEDILVNIRYPFLHRRVLYHLQKNEAFKNFPQVQKDLDTAIKYHCFKELPEAKNDFVGIQYKPRHYQSVSYSATNNCSNTSKRNSLNMPNCVQNNHVTFIQNDLVRSTVHSVSPSNFTQTITSDNSANETGENTILYRTNDTGINLTDTIPWRPPRFNGTFNGNSSPGVRNTPQ